jgi:hypothetical protein
MAAADAYSYVNYRYCGLNLSVLILICQNNGVNVINRYICYKGVFNLDLRENRVFLNSETTGRFSKYELSKVEEVNIKDYVQLSGAPIKDLKNKGISFMYKAEKLFIVPSKDAELLSSSYNPFNDYPDILADFLDLGGKLTDQNILDFCNRYGLFNLSGLYSNDFGNSQEIDYDGDNYFPYDYEWVLLSRIGMSVLDDGYHSMETMQIKQFANEFFPETWEGYKGVIESKDLHNILSNNYYCEPLNYLKTEISNRYEVFTGWLNDTDNGKSPLQLRDEYIGQLITYPIYLTIDYDRGWRYRWVYKSLFDAIDIMFINNIVESTEKVKLCRNCNSAFIQSKSSHAYCSDRCNNSARQRRFQQRKKEGN